MSIVFELGALVAVALVFLVAFRILKSLVKALFMGAVLLVIVGAWIAYSHGMIWK